MKKSEKRQKSVVFGVLLLLTGFLILIVGARSLLDNQQRLLAPKAMLTVEVVETPEDKSRGLSGRTSLGNGRGMLFKFDVESDTHCFWMKDMNFAIDMIWLDSDKRVVHIEENVTPETYPNTFCPDEPAQFVLEINANKSAEYGIVIGEELRF